MSYLILGRDDDLTSALQERLSATEECVVATEGTVFRRLSPSTYALDPSAAESFGRLLDHFGESFPETIVHLWSWQRGIRRGRGDEEGAGQEALPVFLLARELARRRPKVEVRFLYVYPAVAGEAAPQHAAMGALAKTVRLESRRIQLTALCVSHGGDQVAPPQAVVEAVEQELAALGDDPEVRFEDGKRWVRRLAQTSPSAPGDRTDGTVERSHLPEAGVYLITGGVGNLGSITARYLVETLGARVMLAGRSRFDDRIKTLIHDLRALGGKAAYLRTDVTDRDQVKALVDSTKDQFGRIDGIVHCAGVLRDSLLTRKTKEEFAAVLAPKMLGAIYLDEATRNEPLDCFLLFSSIAAVLGNVGQADYSYANAFLDHFAEWRERQRARGSRFGRTLAINWPLWKDGGMGIDAETEKLLRTTLGMEPLSTESGLDVLSRALSMPGHHFLAAEGDPAKMMRFFGLAGGPGRSGPDRETVDPPRNEPPPGAAPERPAVNGHVALKTIEGSDNGTALSLLQNDLKGGVVEILGLRPKDVNLDDDLSNFGFDSLTFTTFSNRINEGYELEVTPVIFFEYDTIREVSEHLYSEHADHFNHFYSSLAAEQPVTEEPTPTASRGSEGAIDRSAPPREGESPPTVAASSSAAAAKKTPSHPSTPIVASGESRRGDRGVAEPIAIIGMSGIMPQCDDLAEFWASLKAERNLVTEVPAERWDWNAIYGDPFQEVGKTRIKWGGFMRRVDSFDAEFFGIAPREAELMDPQQRIFLQTVWRTIEDAGYRVSELARQRVGLFCGVASLDYHDLMVQSQPGAEVFSVTGTMFSVLVNRISYLLDFRGPSEPVETACSSSLVAIHRALRAIHNSECEVALAGGVHVMLTPSVHVALDKGGFLSPQGKCRTFDEKADGYVRSEGTGAVLLKPLRRALADGDHICAVIKGSAVNHGGSVNTLTTPNPNAQTEVIVEAWRQAGVDPSTISYIEAHGTGTALGDPLEIKALKKAFAQLYDGWGNGRSDRKHCGLGSVKSNVGHLEFVAGISGLLKMLLALEHRTIPASIHFDELNPYIRLDDSPFEIISETRPWETLQDSDGAPLPRRTGVSSFGFGGVNAHVALEAHGADDDRAHSLDDQRPHLVVLSAKSPERLQAYAASFSAFLRDWPPGDRPVGREPQRSRVASAPRLADLAFTLRSGREAMSERLAMVVSSLEEMVSCLDAYQEGEARADLFWSAERELAHGEPTERDLDEAEALLASHLVSGDLREIARLWVDGVDVDWNQLPKEPQARRTPLPTYPFAPTRYWLPDAPPRPGSSLEEPVAVPGESSPTDERDGEVHRAILGLLQDQKIDKAEALALLEAADQPNGAGPAPRHG